MFDIGWHGRSYHTQYIQGNIQQQAYCTKMVAEYNFNHATKKVQGYHIENQVIPIGMD
jgi:hypothetical protein